MPSFSKKHDLHSRVFMRTTISNVFWIWHQPLTWLLVIVAEIWPQIHIQRQILRHIPRSRNQMIRSISDSCPIISDITSLSYLIMSDHTKNRTQNRSLRNLISFLTKEIMYDPSIRSWMIIYDSYNKIITNLFTNASE